MLDTPQKRLKWFIDTRFERQNKFAEKMEMSTGDVPKYTKPGGSVLSSPEKVKKLLDMGLNLNWYFTGVGDSLLNPDSEAEIPSKDADLQQQINSLRRTVNDLKEFVQEAKAPPAEINLIGTCLSKEKANERLKEFIKEYYNNNIASIARVMSVARQSISLYLNKDASIGNKFLERIEQAGANPLWIEYGIGPMRNEMDIEQLKQTPKAEEVEVSTSDWSSVKNLESLSKEQLIELSKNINKLVITHDEH